MKKISETLCLILIFGSLACGVFGSIAYVIYDLTKGFFK